MRRVTASLPLPLADDLCAAAARLSCSRAEVARRALAHYLEALEDAEDAAPAARRLDDPDDPTLEWAQVRGKHLAPDAA